VSYSVEASDTSSTFSTSLLETYLVALITSAVENTFDFLAFSLSELLVPLAGEEDCYLTFP
jgi:hypothetical protein